MPSTVLSMCINMSYPKNNSISNELWVSFTLSHLIIIGSLSDDPSKGRYFAVEFVGKNKLRIMSLSP